MCRQLEITSDDKTFQLPLRKTAEVISIESKTSNFEAWVKFTSAWSNKRVQVILSVAYQPRYRA